MDGIPLRLHFPGADLEEVQNTFNPQKEVSSILEFAVNKFPDKVLPNSHILIPKDQKFDLISPNVLIGSLNFRPQQQILIIPETYQITISDPQGKNYPIDIKVNLKVGEVLQYICIQSQLQEPRFYQITTSQTGQQLLVLDPDNSFTSQAPYASTFNVQPLPPLSVNQILVDDFKNDRFISTEKEMHFIIGSLMQTSLGPYKNTLQIQQLEMEARKFMPLTIINKGITDVDYIKSATKASCDIYKKLKPTQDPIQSINTYIMELPHFSATEMNGERFLTQTGSKRSIHEKVTIALLFSSIRVYKQSSSTLLETYFISNIQKLKQEGNTSFQFDYDIPQKGLHTVQFTCENPEIIVTPLKERMKNPSASFKNIESSEAQVSINIAPFAAQFNLYSEIPRRELMCSTASACIALLEYDKEPRAKYLDGILSNKDAKSLSSDLEGLSNSVQNALKMLPIISEEMTRNLSKAYNPIPSFAFQLIQIRSELMVVKLQEAENKKKKKGKKGEDPLKDLEDQEKSLQNQFVEAMSNFSKVNDKTIDDLNSLLKCEESGFHVQPIAVTVLRPALLFLLANYWANDYIRDPDRIETVKRKVSTLLRHVSDIHFYAGGHLAVNKKIDKFIVRCHALISALEKSPGTRYLRAVLDADLQQLESSQAALRDYIEKSGKVTLVEPLSGDIPPLEKDEPRQLISQSKTLIQNLTERPNKSNEKHHSKALTLRQKEHYLKQLKEKLKALLGMSAKGTHEPLILAFNDFKGEVERSFADGGQTNCSGAGIRCEKALDAVFQSMNPANELRQQLSQFSSDDARASALREIIDYLDENGPLFYGSSMHVDIQRFIAQMGLAKTATLTGLAITIESGLPEHLRKLTDTCDPCKNLYNEVDGDLEVDELAKGAKQASDSAAKAAVALRQALRDGEKEAATKYRALNQRLWRVMVVFGQFAAAESAGSIGHTAFTQCRDAFRTLIEEAAYDMKREQSFMEFIDEFTAKVDAVVQSPHRSQALSALSGFLLMHQTRPGFYAAAKALADFNHYVLCVDSNAAAAELCNQSIEEKNFKNVSLIVASIRSRYMTVLNKCELSMKTKIMRDSKRSDIDLRGDYAIFLKNYTRELFIIFSQLIVAKSTNQQAVQALSTGCDAIEKLLPSIANLEFAAPYLARSVCGIVLASMEGLIAECKVRGGKAAQSADLAFSAVREFLFDVRRKIAENERDKMSQKSGIGIADMLAVIERDNHAISEAVEFQREVRKRKWN